MPHPFPAGFEARTQRRVSKVWTSATTAEREEVKLTRFLEALQSPRHHRKLLPSQQSSQ